MKKMITGLLVMVGLAACQPNISDYDKNGGNEKATSAPTVQKVTPVGDYGVVLDDVSMGSMVAIHGKNLSGLKTLLFNDIAVDLRDVYVTNKLIVAPVPRVVPDVISNTMTVKTEKGQTVYDLTVVVPVLRIDGLYNEFSAAGAPAKIMGDYFDIYDLNAETATVTVAGAPAAVTAATDKSLTITIPAGTPAGSVIELSGGRLAAPVQMKWREQGQLLMKYGQVIDGSDDGMWGGGENVTDGSHPGDPAPLQDIARFIRYVGSPDAWAWISVYCAGFTATAEVCANPEDYLFKFEMLTAADRPITIGKFIIYNDQPDAQRLNWNPAAEMAFNTYGEWRTMSLEVTAVFTPWKAVEGWNNICVILQPTGATLWDFSIANGRIVHK